MAAAEGQPERAARLFGAAEVMWVAIGISATPFVRAVYDRSEATTRAALGDAAFAKTWMEGRAMTTETAVEYALEEPPDPS